MLLPLLLSLPGHCIAAVAVVAIVLVSMCAVAAAFFPSLLLHAPLLQPLPLTTLTY
jgi:hypothetical protein